MITDPSALLRRLNSYCARALEAAASLCQTRAHAEITLEHWLIKLLEQGSGDITVIAKRYQLDLDAIWQALLKQLDELPHSIQQKPLLSDGIQALLTSAWLIASLEAQTDQIRSAHLLQALLDSPQWLKTRDAWPLLSVSKIQLQRLLPTLDQQSEENPLKAALADRDIEFNSLFQPNRDTKATSTVEQASLANSAVLDRFTINLTTRAKAEKIDPVFGRDDEIRQMIDILSRRRKNNPILVGDPGVGKTALVEGLALRIVQGNVPESLKNTQIHNLDLGLLQAGAGVKGEFEQRLKNVIEAVQQSAVPILLFIDEAHTIIGTGNQASGADAANLLKPALARGELRTIAATTWSEYKQYFERDAALERRFQKIKVDEPNDEIACLMLRGLKSRYAQHHGVHILDSAVQTAVTLSRRYLTGRQLPNKAIDLIDTAAARVRMSLDTTPEKITQQLANQTALLVERTALQQDQELGESIDEARLIRIEQQLNALQIELTTLNQQYQREKIQINQLINTRKQYAHSLDPKRKDQIDQQRAALTKIQNNSPLLLLDVDSKIIASVIADWTGISIKSLLKNEQSHLLKIEAELSKQVIGQHLALSELAKRLRAAKTGLTAQDCPLGVFLLVGPSGVGKTETALALANQLFGGQQALITINLSEYQEAHTVSQLKGSPPGYVGYGQGGILTEAVRKRPYSVILLDEVEKAHTDVLNLFYQVFDRGVMRDGEGREIDFRHSLIVMTSNLGSDQLQAMLEIQPETATTALQELLRPILRQHFQPALLARFQTIIYRPLNVDAMRNIVMIKLNKVADRLQQHYDVYFKVEESIYDQLANACLLPDTGARNIDSLLNQQILPVISQLLLKLQAKQQMPKSITLGFEGDQGITLTTDNDNLMANGDQGREQP